jgi:hypothetical protein
MVVPASHKGRTMVRFHPRPPISVNCFTLGDVAQLVEVGVLKILQCGFEPRRPYKSLLV